MKTQAKFQIAINNDFNSQVQSHFLLRNWNIGGDVFVSFFYAPSSVSEKNQHRCGFHNFNQIRVLVDYGNGRGHTDTRQCWFHLPFFLFLSHCQKKNGERGSETWPTEEKRVSVKQASKQNHVIQLSYPTPTALSRSLLSLPLLQQENNNNPLQ